MPVVLVGERLDDAVEQVAQRPRSLSEIPSRAALMTWWRASNACSRLARPASETSTRLARPSSGSSVRSSSPRSSSCRACRLTMKASSRSAWASAESRIGPWCSSSLRIGKAE